MKVRKTVYSDGISCKFDNRRVTVGMCENGQYLIDFKIIDPEGEPRAKHKFIKNKIVSTSFTLSKEATQVLSLILNEMLHENPL